MYSFMSSELTVIAEEVIMGKRAKGGEAPPAVAVETARDRLISATMTRALVGPMAVLVLFYFAPRLVGGIILYQL